MYICIPNDQARVEIKNSTRIDEEETLKRPRPKKNPSDPSSSGWYQIV